MSSLRERCSGGGRRRTPAALACAIGAFSGVFACTHEPSEQSAGGAAARELPPSPASRALSSPTAFELAVAESGAVLGWVGGGALHVLRFDRRGEGSPSPPIELPGAPPADAALADLELAETSAGLAVIWREAAVGTAAARGLWLEPSGAVEALSLGAAWDGGSDGRGNLALVSRGASALALVRGRREECSDPAAQDCFGFRFHQLSPSGAVATGLGLSVPVPCDAGAAQLIAAPAGAGAAVEPRFHYAVCTRSERAPVLTVFSIEPDRSYAAAHQVFSGCTPLGAGYFAGRPSFVAECQGARRVARVPGADAPFELRDIDVRGLVCGVRGARVRLGGDWLELDRPAERLELLLDTELSPPGSRAVWTGAALLVARAVEGRLALERYACSGTELQKLQSPLD